MVPYNAQREEVAQQPAAPQQANPIQGNNQGGLILPSSLLNNAPKRIGSQRPTPKLVQHSIDSTQPSGSLEESSHLENNFVGLSNQPNGHGNPRNMTHYQTYSNGAHFVGSSNQAEENARKALDSANSTRSEKKEGGSSSLSTMSGETMAAFARRLREMEKQLQSIRPEVERKIIQTIQENPKELAEALRGLEANEISLWSENSKRQMNSQNELETLREMMKQTRDGLLEAMKSVNSRMDGLEYRSSGLEKTVSGIGKRLNVISRGYLQGDSASMRNERVALTDGSENNHEGRLVSAHHMVSEFTQHPRVFGGDTKNNGLIGMSNEINLLREALQKEKASKDAFVRDLTNQYNDVHQIVFKNEREYFERLNAQRDEFLKEANFTREQLRKLEETRMNKVIGDSEYMKAMVAQVERKVSDEIQRRVAMDFDNQNFIEQRFKKMKDEIMKGQKKSLSEEFQFINNLKETIGGMNEIIQNTKAQLETSILTTQTMALENVSNLSSALESLKDAAFTRMTANELALNELGQNMSQTMGNLSQFSKKLKEQVESDLASQKTRASEFFSEIEKDWRSLKNQMKAKEQKQEEFNKGAQEETKKLAEAFKSELKKANESSLGQNDSLSKRIEAFRKELEQKEGMFEKLYKHLETQLRTEEQNSQFRLKELGKEMENQIRSQMAGVSEEIMKGDKEVLRIGEEKLKKELRSVEAALKSLEESQKVLWKGDIESARVKLQEKMDIQRKELEEKAKEESARVDQGVAKVKREFDEKVADVRKSIVVEAGKRKEEQNQLAYSINEKIDGTFEGVRNYTREVASDIRNDFDKLMAQVKEKAEIELNGAKEALNRQIEKTKGEVTQAAARGVEAAMDQVEEKLKGVNKRITDLSENTKNAMEQQKRMLLEDIEQRAEQVKSLSKALVTEEIAERLKADENLMQMFNSSISSVKDLFNGLMDQMRSEFLENMSDMDKKFTDLIEEMRNWASKEFEDIRNKAESEQVEREAVGYLDFVYFSLYEDDENRYREHVHKYLKENERESQETVERIGKNAQKIEEKLNENVERLDKKDEEIMGQIERMKNEALREKSDSQKQLEEERNERIEEDKRVMGELRELDKFMTSEVAALDEQLKNTGVELQLDIQSRDYAQRLYNKIFEEDVTKRFLLQRNSLKELELVFDQFEEKTDKNFKVAEKTINSLFRTANHLDAQFYLEYLETRASFADIEQRLRMELGSVSDRMELSVDEIQSKITKILKEEIPLTIGGMSQERQKDQTIIEKRLSQLSENIEKVSNALDSTTSRVSEQENTTSFHEKRIEKNEK